MKPEGAAILRSRSQLDRPSLHCLPWSIPTATLFSPVHKIVQTPGLIVMIHEVDGATRQIYTDEAQTADRSATGMVRLLGRQVAGRHSRG